MFPCSFLFWLENQISIKNPSKDTQILLVQKASSLHLQLEIIMWILSLASVTRLQSLGASPCAWATVVNHTTPQIDHSDPHTVCPELSSLGETGRTGVLRDDSSHKLNWRFTSRLDNVSLVRVCTLDFFPVENSPLSLCFPKGKTASKIIIIEQSSYYAMNKHSSKKQLALVITTRAYGSWTTELCDLAKII